MWSAKTIGSPTTLNLLRCGADNLFVRRGGEDELAARVDLLHGELGGCVGGVRGGGAPTERRSRQKGCLLYTSPSPRD